MTARNPFGIHTREPLFDIYDVAHLADREVWTMRRIFKERNVQAVARTGRRLLYRASDFLDQVPQPVGESIPDDDYNDLLNG